MNNDWLAKDDYVPYAPEEAGATVAIEHCHPGKKRLYITRTDDGLGILGYCHHCGKRGYHSETHNATIFSLKKRKAALGTVDRSSGNFKYKLPDDCEGDTRLWPSEARVWPMRYGLTEGELNDHHICYSTFLGGVVLPVYDSDGLALYTTRIIPEVEGKPKYYTVANRKHAVWYCANRTHSNAVVVVEDILSAIKCSRHISACAILNTHLHETGLHLLTKHHSEFIVFLDDDNTEVRKKQLQIKNRLDVFGHTRIVHSKGHDPKEHTDEELKRILL